MTSYLHSDLEAGRIAVSAVAEFYEDKLRTLREGLEREAATAERYANGPHGALHTAWADMAGNLRQLARSNATRTRSLEKPLSREASHG